jgi:predicted nucleic acid-binding protein
MRDRTPPVPYGIFLDSSIVIYLEKYGEQIFDGVAVDPALPWQLQEQLEALRVLMMLAFRAGFAFAVSPAVIDQVGSSYVRDIAAHWHQARDDWGIKERDLAPMTVISSLPKRDQTVIAQAYRSGCEVLLTNDLRLLKPTHHLTLAELGLDAYTPQGLITFLGPWLALWL